MLLLVAVIIGAFIATGIARSIASEARNAVCTIAGAECADGPTAGTASTRAEQLAELERREQALAPLAESRRGLQPRSWPGRARRASAVTSTRPSGCSSCSSSTRGCATATAATSSTRSTGPSATAFEDLVAQGTIDEDGGRNRRYFQVPPSPGEGLLVQDFFIPSASSGGLLDGDDRDTVDPLLGDADSRTRGSSSSSTARPGAA